MFKLTEKALLAIKDPQVRRKLAEVLLCTDQTIMKYIKDNDDTLTKAAAMLVIKKETGLSDEEILEEVKPVEERLR
jgi:hypothetical protein